LYEILNTDVGLTTKNHAMCRKAGCYFYCDVFWLTERMIYTGWHRYEALWTRWS